MKQLIRAIALIALVSLFFTCAFAEGGSFEELVAQRQELDRQVIAAGIGYVWAANIIRWGEAK